MKRLHLVASVVAVAACSPQSPTEGDRQAPLADNGASVRGAAYQGEDHGCMTLRMHAALGNRSPGSLFTGDRPRDGEDPPYTLAAKENRDAIGSFPNELASDNFVIKWGDEGEVATEKVQQLSAALETSWTVIIDERGWPLPYGADSYRLNVYVGGTGSGTPSQYGSYAYAMMDDEGYPALVYSPQRIDYVEKSISSAAHEFLHTIQFTIGAFDQLPGPGSWWIEASATWMAEEVFPEQFWAGYLPAAGAYAMLPHLSIENAEPPGITWQVRQGHHYGAFLFARHLSDHQPDLGPDFIKETHLEADGNQNALGVISDRLQEHGLEPLDVWRDYVVRNIAWDYQNGDAYKTITDWMAQQYPADNAYWAETVPADGGTMHSAPQSTLPRNAGYNLILLDNPVAGDLRVTFAGGTNGTGTAPEWVVVLMGQSASNWERIDVPLESAEALLVVPEVQRFQRVVLAVSPWSPGAHHEEAFAYSYGMEIGSWSEEVARPPDPSPSAPPPVDTGDCSVSMTPSRTGTGWVLLFSLILSISSQARRRWRS